MRMRVNLRIYDIILHKSRAGPAPTRNHNPNPNQKGNNEFMITIRITSMIRKNIQAIL
jgi:hypothetical protein